MKCEEAAEFVSAVCDGELIPSDIASHIGNCERCAALLRDFVEISAELRRMASLQVPRTVRPAVWERKRSKLTMMWQKGWETMRIPKLAFAILVMVILALGSGLVITKVRAQGGGSVVMLTIKPEGGEATRCAISSVNPQFGYCGGMTMANSGLLMYEIRVLGSESGRIQLGVRSKFQNHPTGPVTFNITEFAREPQRRYWFEPGQQLDLEVPALGTMAVTGEFMDHMPTRLSIADNNELDPRADELRISSPLLLRDNTTVFDFDGMISIADHNIPAVQVYEPGLGRYIFSLLPLPGAVQAKVADSRISYEIGGHKYQLLTGSPISRAEYAWVLQQPNYRPSQDSTGQRDDQPFSGSVDPKHVGDVVVR